MRDSKAALAAVQKAIDAIDCVGDGPVVFINGFGRICAKVESRRFGTMAGFGDTVEEAMGSLIADISKIQERYTERKTCTHP